MTAPAVPHLPVELPGGLVLRTGRPADLDQVGALLVARGEEPDALDHRLVVEDPDAGWDACAVVVHGDRVVSTATLLDETVRVGDVVLPAGQVELVATDREYEGRGLVRALMGWAHDRSRARGHLLQVMIGIPYFYRRFGYEYAIDIPPARALVGSPAAETTTVPGVPATSVIGTTTAPGAAGSAASGAGSAGLRRAELRDLPAITALQEAAQALFDVAMPHSEPRRRWVLAHDGSTTWVLERDGTVVATARTTPPDDGVLVAEAAALDPAAAEELLRALGAMDPGQRLSVVHRTGTVAGDSWEARLAPPSDQAEQYYARIERPEAVLDALRPVLTRRLKASGLDRIGQDVVISTFARHYRLTVLPDGELGPVRIGGRMQSPGVERGAGVAPDAVPALLLGPYGIAGLTRRRPDVYPGPDAELFEALFPPLRADLLTYYLPW